MRRTVEEINEKIKKGDAVVMTAEEVIGVVDRDGIDKATKEVDVVTTGTFGAMCSSGAFINFGHSEPPIKMTKVWLNDVPAYAGLAAVDAYIGATEPRQDGNIEYGGAHVIEDLISNRPVRLRATSYGTDCYPRKDIDTYISLKTVNQAYMFNPRNAYQNYGVATNSSERTLFTYMGKLLPHYGNATYSSAGQLSPLLKDPNMRTIGIGTRIFLGGAQGYVAWEGTQFKTNSAVKNGVPVSASRTLAVIGDLKQMSSEFIRALSFKNYGVSLAVGLGVPIPILDEDVMRAASVREDQIFAPVLDYAVQSRTRRPVREISYAELRSGSIEINGKKVKTSSLSSYAKARQVAETLKNQIAKGEFLLTQAVAGLPEERVQGPLDVHSQDEVRS
jgi:uncharacterized protein (DUF39 family)